LTAGKAPEGGSLAPEGGSLAPEGGSLAPEGGSLAPEGGSLAPEGGSLLRSKLVYLDYECQAFIIMGNQPSSPDFAEPFAGSNLAGLDPAKNASCGVSLSRIVRNNPAKMDTIQGC